MDEKRRAEIRAIVDHFKGVPLTPSIQDRLKEYCEVHHVEPIVLSDLKDYTVQVEHDEVVGRMFPLILAELQKLTFMPEFASEEERRAITKQNDEVRVAITKLYETHELRYEFVNPLAEELGNFVGGKIAMAGTTAFNKSLQVLLHLARTRFGGEFNMGHAAKYAVEVFDAVDKGRK